MNKVKKPVVLEKFLQVSLVQSTFFCKVKVYLLRVELRVRTGKKIPETVIQ